MTRMGIRQRTQMAGLSISVQANVRAANVMPELKLSFARGFKV